ncbi:MAG: hypothetical protein OXH38_11830 [Chloroflexi bacterium]|nr:hypothetical protein [Chloroflexota bacterium]
MTRRRWVWVPGEGLVEVTDTQRAASPEIIPDVQDAFRSPVDGSMITSRRDLRAHNARNGVRQLGNDRMPPRKPREINARKVAQTLWHTLHPP